MLNTEEFIKRLEFIMEHFGFNASSFADKIGVQRSSISHLLAGRNKPSLDFIMKILNLFPELNLYWVLDGSGHFLKNNDFEISSNKVNSITPIDFDNEDKTESASSLNKKNVSENSETSVPNKNEFIKSSDLNQIEKIIFFYTDGTFFAYRPPNGK